MLACDSPRIPVCPLHTPSSPPLSFPGLPLASVTPSLKALVLASSRCCVLMLGADDDGVILLSEAQPFDLTKASL